MRRALLLALSVAGNAAHGGESDLGEIVVTARQPVVEQAGSVQELERVDIERSAARTLDEAIARLPGVNVRVGGQGTPRIDVRGLRTRQVKLLVNGIPFNSAADGQFDPTIIPTDWIERIKLTKGASSQLYGDGALGGVINIITRRGEGPPTAEVNLEAGDYGSRRYYGTYAYGTEQGDVFVSIGRQARDGFRLSDDLTPAPFEDGDERLNSDSVRNSAYLAASYRPADAWEFGLTVQYLDGDHGIPTGIFDNDVDIFAQRPRFDRVDDERSYYAQVNALYSPNETLVNNAWAYLSSGTTELNRFEDARYLPTVDPSVRNTFSDEARTRTLGLHNQTEFTHRFGGTLSFMVDARQERLNGECVIQDVPLVVPAPAAATAAPAVAAPAAATPTALVLDYTYTTTNNHGATNAAGGNQPIARLSATNRAGGGVDFSITNLASNNFGAATFLQSVFITPIAGFDPTGITFTQAVGSQGDIGNVRFFTTLENADGYLYPIQVNYRRPGQGDPFLQGETAAWLFNKGTVTDFFGQAAAEAGPLGPDMFSAIRIRDADAAGFWGVSDVDVTGAGNLNRVFVQAPQVVDPNAAPGGPAAPPPLVEDPDVTGNLLQDRVCGGGAGGGDGSGGGDGGGDGTGGNRVERLPGFVFGKRLIAQDRAIEVLSTALELSVRPMSRLGLVAGFGQHWLAGDNGEVEGDLSYGFAAAFDATAATRLKASYARKVRPPSIAQLHDPVSGNADLEFEIADSYEAGIEQRLPRQSRAEVTFFVEDVFGFIQRDIASGLFANVAETRFQGVEVSGVTNPTPALRLELGYTYIASRDESAGTVRKQQQYTPANSVSFTADYTLMPGLELHTSLQRVADQYFYSRGTPQIRRGLDAYTLFDANLRYELPGKRVSVYIGADNLFDSNYEESYGLPQAGRFVYGGIKIKLL